MRVTGIGVEDVLEGCHKLRVLDVSQCKNLLPWLEAGGGIRWGEKVRSEVVVRADRVGNRGRGRTGSRSRL